MTTIAPLPGQDWTAFLKAKLEDRNPKCGNCKSWVVIHPEEIFGACQLAAKNMPTAVFTPSLSTGCHMWEKKE